MAESQVKIQLTAEDKQTPVINKAAASLEQYKASYESLTDYMKRTAGDAQQAANANNQLADSADKVADSLDDAADSSEQAGGRFDGLFGTFTKANLAANAITKGIELVTSAIKGSVTDAASMERSLMGLNSTAVAFGVSTQAVNSSVKTLSSDGLIGFTTTATALKTLLSTGMGLDSATTLIQRFKDEAANGRAETIDYGTAVGNLAQAYKTNSSELGDLSGHVGNFSSAIEIGASALGKNVSQLTAAETEQAKLIGYMQDGAHTAGNAAAFADTYSGSLARQAAESEKTSATLGQGLLPAMEYITGTFTGLLTSTNDSVSGLQTFQAYLVTLAAVTRSVANVFIGSFQSIWGAAKSLATLSWKPFQQGLESASDGFKDTWTDAFEQYEKIYSDSNDAYLDNVSTVLKDANGEYDAAAKRRAEQEEDANKQYKRSMEQRSKQFAESMRDMIISHRDKSNSLKSDLSKEDAAYTKSKLLREQDYLEDIEDMEASHAEKLSDINEKISEEKNSGLVVDGILYQEANQQKIAKLEAQLATEESKYQEALAKRKADYAQDVSEDKTRHDDKMMQLQTSLSEEMALLELHRTEVAAVGNAQKEDEISRLKRQFSEGNAEAERNHQEQLAKIRSAGTAQGSAYGTNLVEATKPGVDETKKLLDDAFNKAQSNASNKGRETGTHWWTSFKDTLSSWFSGFPDLVSEWINNGSSSIKAKTQHQFTGPLGGVGNLFSDAIDWITKREGGGPVTAGQPYVVGEKEAELFVPNQSGQILNQQQIRSALSGGQQSSGRSVSVNIGTVINQSTMDPDAFFKSMTWQLRTA